jgi:hypothetical protein
MKKKYTMNKRRKFRKFIILNTDVLDCSLSWLVTYIWNTDFTVSRLLTDFVCLYTYEFWLSLCKIARSSVILLLPLLWLIYTISSNLFLLNPANYFQIYVTSQESEQSSTSVFRIINFLNFLRLFIVYFFFHSVILLLPLLATPSNSWHLSLPSISDFVLKLLSFNKRRKFRKFIILNTDVLDCSLSWLVTYIWK